jgi:VanZ family protein
MKTGKEQKFFTIILIFYWAGILIATHIPVPSWARQMDTSDKTMHFFAYMILAILLWLSRSFDKKANWKELRPWLLSIIVILYGLVDELSQHFMNRSTDISDFAANTLGLAVAMAIATVLSAYHIVMILITVCPLFAPGIIRSQLIPQNSIYEAAAYMMGFAIITAAWIKYLPSVFNLNVRKNNLLFFAPPAVTIIIVKFYAQLTNKPFSSTAIISAFVSIALTLFIRRLMSKKGTAI